MAEPTDFEPVTGNHLRDWGHPPGPRYPELLAQANAMRAEGYGLVKIRDVLAAEIPPAPVQQGLRAANALPFHANIDAAHPDEEKNVAKVRETMTELMRVPTVEAGAMMPDACPAGPVGTIPVGGVVAARNAIHPGMHSADICCSVMLSDLGTLEPKVALDAAQAVTHFGPGGRSADRRWTPPAEIAAALRENPFTKGEKTRNLAEAHFGTQGDGNHFLFVGRSRNTGRTMLISHHGSRGPGAMVYKAGMAAAERHRQAVSPETQRQNAWIPADSEDGQAYWAALQLMRAWTKANHEAIHDRAVEMAGGALADRFWNEHNFVFKRGDLFYHGKGATPAWDDYAADATGLTMIPLNMAEPVLVVRGKDAAHGLGFSPHGAGRNVSRTAHKRRMGATTPEQALKAETAGLDVRFFAGGIDASELPSSYKDASSVVAQIQSYGLAEIVDYIDPYGSIMAGDIPPFWLNRKKKRGPSARSG
ncbi:MAG: RtcB family protein [Pseudomonadota bacterium]